MQCKETKGDVHIDTCLYCFLNLIKANKLITDLLCDQTTSEEANLLSLLWLHKQIILFYYTKVTREINFWGQQIKERPQHSE